MEGRNWRGEQRPASWRDFSVFPFLNYVPLFLREFTQGINCAPLFTWTCVRCTSSPTIIRSGRRRSVFVSSSATIGITCGNIPRSSRDATYDRRAQRRDVLTPWEEEEPRRHSLPVPLIVTSVAILELFFTRFNHYN